MEYTDISNTNYLQYISVYKTYYTNVVCNPVKKQKLQHLYYLFIYFYLFVNDDDVSIVRLQCSHSRACI